MAFVRALVYTGDAVVIAVSSGRSFHFSSDHQATSPTFRALANINGVESSVMRLLLLIFVIPECYYWKKITYLWREKYSSGGSHVLCATEFDWVRTRTSQKYQWCFVFMIWVTGFWSCLVKVDIVSCSPVSFLWYPSVAHVVLLTTSSFCSLCEKARDWKGVWDWALFLHVRGQPWLGQRPTAGTVAWGSF